MTHSLFSPVTLGSVTLANRLVMAPMTRARAPETVPTAIMADYYRQRASAGLILTEATQVATTGQGSIATPGIHSPEQIAGWRNVTDAVHEAGGKIACQLWHVGRVGHASLLPEGEVPVSSSAVAGEVQTFTAEGFVKTTPPRALALDEIPIVVNQYAQGAVNALEAGFDCVEIHGANGYLIEQFLRDGVNQRDDAYGGSIENRCRFLLDVIDAVIDAVGGDKTGLRISPFSDTWDCRDSNLPKLYEYVVKALNKRDFAFLEIVEEINGSDISQGGQDDAYNTDQLAAHYEGDIILNGGYTAERAKSVIESGKAAAVSVGRPWISNPDIPARFEQGAELADYSDPSHWYGGGAEGYSDYPTM